MKTNTLHAVKFPSLDWIRAVAALSVFAHHYYQQYPEFFLNKNFADLMSHLGAWGVSLFFVLSGFCIHFARIKEVNVFGVFDRKKYVIRRFFRIYPALFFSTILCFVVTRYYTTNLMHEATLASVLANLTLTSSFFVGLHSSAVNNVLWSVVVECHFYIIYFFLWKFFKNTEATIKITLVAIFISAVFYVISVTLAEAGKTRIMIQTVFLTTWWSWCLGACVAELIYYKKIAFKNNKLNRACCIAALLITLLICFLPKPYNLHAQRFVLPLAAAIFLYFLLLEEFYFIGSRYLVELGSISYSLYLLHPLAILVGVEVGLSFFYTTILVLLIGIFGAFLSYKFIEIPFVTLGSKVKI